jgi:hypothetical protein
MEKGATNAGIVAIAPPEQQGISSLHLANEANRRLPWSGFN